MNRIFYFILLFQCSYLTQGQTPGIYYLKTAFNDYLSFKNGEVDFSTNQDKWALISGNDHAFYLKHVESGQFLSIRDDVCILTHIANDPNAQWIWVQNNLLNVKTQLFTTGNDNKTFCYSITTLSLDRITDLTPEPDQGSRSFPNATPGGARNPGRKPPQTNSWAGGTITGTVSDRDGNPIQNAYVTCAGKGASTNEKGEYMLPKIKIGTHEIKVKDCNLNPEPSKRCSDQGPRKKSPKLLRWKPVFIKIDITEPHKTQNFTAQ
jgi:hypothetical protein